MNELISFYNKCLSELLLVEYPTSLMKKVIRTIQSPEERVYMYEVTKHYATLFLSDEMCTVYLYPDLTCSLLKPPPKPTIPHWRSYIYQANKNANNTKPIDIKWLYKILEEAVYEKDKKIVEDFIEGNPINPKEKEIYQADQDLYQPDQDLYQPDQDLYQPDQDLYQPDQDLYQTDQDLYQPDYQPDQDLYESKSKCISDSPDYGPDFGPDLCKGLDFTFVDLPPVKKELKKLKTVVKKIIKQKPTWK
jgi:hypothetical protein